MITSGMFDPGTGAPMGEPMTPYSTESVWEPGPVESEDPHNDPYGDLDLGPIPLNIMRGVVLGPMSRSRQGG